MKLTNVAQFSNIDDYVQDKIARYGKEEKNFETLFSYMFSERENVMAEISDGYRIKKITYGACADKILSLYPSVEQSLAFAPKGSIVGLYMANCIEWIEIFWSILMAGYHPLLMNSRLNADVLEDVLQEYGVSAVVSDGKTFSVKTVNVADVFALPTVKTAEKPTWGQEVLFMTSGTTDNVKLCAYTGENFYYQICDSVNIITKCPQMKKHVDGELKILALLPFYHVFGFIAVYTWFAFFSRTLVFLKDLNPQTLLNTVRKHKVTHIFAVPLVWETVYKKALQKIKSRGEKTYRKFEKALAFVSSHEKLGSWLSKSAFKEIREGLFGDSICFLITGGSGISQDALQFFNGIGYHMANGYGMSEIGITSVDISMKRKERNKGSVGAPFGGTGYQISQEGELLVKGKTMATRIMQRGETHNTDFDAWFNTRDLVKRVDGKYYLQGREDDLIVCKNGEKINPELLEGKLKIKNANGVCLFADGKGVPTLLISVTGCFSAEKFRAVYEDALRALDEAQIKDEVPNVLLTVDKLLGDNDFKMSRKKVAKRYNQGQFTLIERDHEESHSAFLLSVLEKELCGCFAKVLQKDESEIGITDDFFSDLGGSSLDYFTLIDVIKAKYGVEIAVSEDKKFSTVREFYEYLK